MHPRLEVNPRMPRRPTGSPRETNKRTSTDRERPAHGRGNQCHVPSPAGRLWIDIEDVGAGTPCMILPPHKQRDRAVLGRVAKMREYPAAVDPVVRRRELQARHFLYDARCSRVGALWNLQLGPRHEIANPRASLQVGRGRCRSWRARRTRFLPRRRGHLRSGARHPSPLSPLEDMQDLVHLGLQPVQSPVHARRRGLHGGGRRDGRDDGDDRAEEQHSPARGSIRVHNA
ncbi:hypothetical protein BMS3Bbin13_00399 [bacterium BMS3Bbin13]|nr:hypothetical protein BMS3Bbin13_00399 [bacterium BMS3Bbin13]